MKKISKILVILSALVIIAISCLFNTSYAADTTTSPGDMIDQSQSFIEKGKELVGATDITSTDITEPIVSMSQVATTIGAGIYLCILAYMGIKWLQAKPDEQAKLKEQSIGVFISGIVIFGGYTIWKIAINITKNL